MAEDSASVTVVEVWRRSVQMGLEAQGPVNDIDPSLGPRWTDAKRAEPEPLSRASDESKAFSNVSERILVPRDWIEF